MPPSRAWRLPPAPPRARPARRAQWQARLDASATLYGDAWAPFRQVHVPQARSLVAPPRPCRARAGQGRVRRRRERFLGGPLPSRLLARGHARRHGPDDPVHGAVARPDPRAARGAEPERPDAICGRIALVSRDDEGVGLLRRAAAARTARGVRPQVPDRLPDVEEARVVP